MTTLRMPAEWERQQAVWLAWPHQRSDWPGKFPTIPLVYGEIIRHLSRTQQVKLLVRDGSMQTKAADLLERVDANLDNVAFYQIPTNRVWLRDSGPIFVKRGRQKIALDWRFNAWAKYRNWRLDNQVPVLIAAKGGPPLIQPEHQGKPVVLEGGAIDVNGAGALLTTEECLLSQAVQCRNPGFTRADYENIFANYLGIDQVIWLSHGIVGDDTHGHVDDITRFVDKNRVVTVVEKHRKDANYAILKKNLQRLQAARVDGKPLDIVELPMPRPLFFEGVRVPASYANFLICNSIVLVPTFNDPADRTALETLARCFPTREILGIHAVDLVWGFGTLHCMSQQEPA
jgi:agmatine deiminase